MADYHPLIARAVAGLERNTGDARRALYERARTALVAQLRGVTPALSESDVTRERLALEEAIRKVEAESARQSWVEQPRPEPARRMRPPEMPRWDDGPNSSSQERRASLPPRTDLLPPRPPASQPRQSNGLSTNGMFGNERYVDPMFDLPIADAEQPSPPPQPLPPPQPSPPPQRHSLRGRALGERRSLLDAGLNDFRNVVTETNEPGEASRSPKSARETRDTYGEAARPPGDIDFEPVDQHAEMLHDSPPRLLEPTIDDETQHAPTRFRMPPPLPGEEPESRPGWGLRDYIRIAIVLLVVAGVAGSLMVLWPTVSQLYRSLGGPPSTDVASETAPAPSGRVKDPVRFEAGQPSQAPESAAVTPGAAVAQRVVLYEEDPNDPQGKRFVGSAIWRTEMVSPGPGMPQELAIRADVEIPERRIAMTWSLRRNTDPNLPASHTVEIVFKLPSDFPARGVSNVPGILMKQAEQTRGTPLSGLAVKVTNGFFLIGLSAVDADRERNVQLLKERAWFDIPVVYSNNRRAILALEKGTPGERAFADAFRVWRQ